MPTDTAVSPQKRAVGLSLWLMPEGAMHDRLSGLIGRLAERLGTERFSPHVTLLPGLVSPEPEVLEGAGELAEALAPFSLSLTGVDGTDAHFRCLFARVELSASLRRGHALAAQRFGLEPALGFDPHLSLVYGGLSAEVKAALTQELRPQLPTSFEARHLRVWRTDGPVEAWREIGLFALERRDV